MAKLLQDAAGQMLAAPLVVSGIGLRQGSCHCAATTKALLELAAETIQGLSLHISYSH